MKIIYLDTETISFPENNPNKDIMFQLAFIEESNNNFTLYSDYMKPESYMNMSPKAMAINHFTPEKIEKFDVKENTKSWNTLKELLENPQEETYLIAHNIAFDKKVIELSGITINKSIKIICTYIVADILNDSLQLALESTSLQYLKYYYRLDKFKESFNEMLFVSNNLEAHNAVFDTVDLLILTNHFIKTMNASYEILHNLTVNPYRLSFVPFGKNRGETFQSLNDYQLKYYADIPGNVGYTAKDIINERYN